MENYVVEMLHITKRFPGIIANDDITLQLKKGEIHALLGENGAGKSTLMSVLFGLYQPEEGQIRMNGQKVDIRNPNDANDLGIGMVHQHFKLVECFTVLDNIIMGVEPVGKLGFLQKKQAREKVLELSQKYCLHVDPDALVEDITVGMQQRTEILKMLYRENDVLIFDEPTAVLTPQEIDELMQIMRNLAAEGKSLEEVAAIAQRFADNMATLAVAVRGATHPSTGAALADLGEDDMEIGMGQHGEGGGGRQPMKSADETAEIMVNALLKDIGIQSGEKVMLIINGSGATTLMEQLIIYRKCEQILKEKNIEIVANYVGELLTVQEQAGFQMFMARMDDELLRLWNAPCRTPYLTKK